MREPGKKALKVQKGPKFTGNLEPFRNFDPVGSGGVDADLLPIPVFAFEFDHAVDQGEKGIILPQTDVAAGMNPGSQLANQDVSGFYGLSAENFNSQALAL